MGFRRSLIRIQSPRHCKASRDNKFRLAFFASWGLVPTPGAELRAEWHWIDVGVARCLDSSNKILSPTIPSGISFVKAFQRTANPPPNTGEGTRQRARNDGN